MMIKTTKSLFCFSYIFFVLAAAAQNENTKTIGSAAAAPPQAVVPVKVGVVLDLDTWVGKLGLSCINMALSDFYSDHNDSKFRLDVVVRDSKQDIVGAAAAALDLIKNEQVKAIIGPRSSMQANFMIDLGNKSQVPIISFSATSPFLTSMRSPYFFRATQNDSSQVKAISAIVQAFGWRQAVPIYADNEFGEGILPYLSDALEEVGARIPYRSVISPVAGDGEIKQELLMLMTMQTRVFIVHMIPDLGARLFDIAKEIGMMEEGFVWIITDGIMNLWSLIDESHSPHDNSKLDSMQGVLGVRPYVPESKKLKQFKLRWKKKFLQEEMDFVNAELDIHGIRAYDATYALALAVEKLPTVGTSSNSSFSSFDVSFGVSPIGPELIQALSSTRFTGGLGGEFGFVNGQLDSSVFQIINVNGNGVKGIGFWTSKNGLIRNLPTSNAGSSSSSYSTTPQGGRLGSITWPGDSHFVPKGWEFPTNKINKLRIGVPVNIGFSEFVKVTWNPSTNYTTVEGFCIDVFEAAVKEMPYAVLHEFLPFEKPNTNSTEMAGTYDDLIHQVVAEKYDAVVGDISIISNRSASVDFTLPFTESGVVMVVPIIDNTNRNAWVFLKPLSPDLWATIGCFFVFIGFVIWVLEHRINGDFRGPPSNHIGTSFWFSFSTMAFAHRERVQSNPARFVVVIWCFVVLIITQSYTASLTTLLTVQQLQPTVTDVYQLLNKGENIGFHDGSFVHGILTEKLAFHPSKLKKFRTPEELDQLFSNGSIAAAFDEIPYMKLFLGKYCNKYTTAEPTFKADGFGFVFPKGSSLVADFSRAILKVTESTRMKDIEKKWIQKNQSSCPDSSGLSRPNSLDARSFRGLFLIAGVAGILALVIFAAQFLHQQKEVLLDSSTSMRSKIVEMSKNFDNKDLTFHTFRGQSSSSTEYSSATDIPQASSSVAVVVEASPPNTNFPPPSSPSSSSEADDCFIFLGDQGRISTDHESINVDTN